MGVRSSATVISQVICQTCPGTKFPQDVDSGHGGAAELGGGDIHLLLDDGGDLLVTSLQMRQLQFENSVWWQYNICCAFVSETGQDQIGQPCKITFC